MFSAYQSPQSTRIEDLKYSNDSSNPMVYHFLPREKEADVPLSRQTKSIMLLKDISKNIPLFSGWWLTYPSEKSESVGIMTCPI